MTVKNIVFLFFFSATFLFPTNIYAQPYSGTVPGSIAYPQRTELVSKKSSVYHPLKSYNYEFISELSGEEILSFYRHLLAQQGITEKKDFLPETDYQKAYFFSKGFLTSVTLTMVELPSEIRRRDKRTKYFISITENYDLLALSVREYTTPKKLDCLPVYLRARQGVRDKDSEEIKGIYLARGKVSDITKFYIENMPDFDWKLVDKTVFKGRYNLMRALTKGSLAADIFQETLSIDIDEFWPGIDVDVEGVCLRYKHKEQDKWGAIQIIKFKDSPQDLARVRIDPEPFQKYGNIYFTAFIKEGDFETSKDEAIRFLEEYGDTTVLCLRGKQNTEVEESVDTEESIDRTASVDQKDIVDVSDSKPVLKTFLPAAIKQR